MDPRILIGLVAALLLFTAAPASADHHEPSHGGPCHLGHDYGGCWTTVAGADVEVCLYTPDGCPDGPVKVQ